MAASSRQAGVPRLREIIDAYRSGQNDILHEPISEAKLAEVVSNRAFHHRHLDNPAHALLGRLGASLEAAKAFERLKLNGPGAGVVILHSCVMAERLFRTFAKRVSAEKDLLGSINDLKRAIKTLEKFVSGHSKLGFVWRGVVENDELTLVRCKPEDFKTMDSGLSLITSLIEGRKHTAKTVDSWLGTTRNKNQKQASENVAIWQVAEGIRRATGKPHVREVADLAEVILKTDVTESRVREIRRKRSPPAMSE